MEGLQTQRYNGIEKDDEGVYCLFSDADKFHESAQVATAKALELKAENMKLTAERDFYKKTLETIASGTEDLMPPYRNVPASRWEEIARGALKPVGEKG